MVVPAFSESALISVDEWLKNRVPRGTIAAAPLPFLIVILIIFVITSPRLGAGLRLGLGGEWAEVAANKRGLTVEFADLLQLSKELNVELVGGAVGGKFGREEVASAEAANEDAIFVGAQDGPGFCLIEAR